MALMRKLLSANCGLKFGPNASSPTPSVTAPNTKTYSVGRSRLPGDRRLNHSLRAAAQLSFAPSQRTAMGTSRMGVNLIRKPSAAATALPIHPHRRDSSSRSSPNSIKKRGIASNQPSSVYKGANSSA